MKTDELTGKYEVEENDENALAMFGEGYPSLVIEPERTILERRNGEFQEVVIPAFVKISTAFKTELAKMDSKSLKVWLFIALSVNRNTGKANPGLRTIAKNTGFGVNTVQDCLKELEASGLLKVDRKSRKYNIYEPTQYVSANRLDPVSGTDTDAETVSEKPETVSENTQTVSEGREKNLLNQRNQRLNQTSKKGDLLDGVLFFAGQAKEQKADKVEEVIQTLERGLKVNISRNTKNQAVAKRLLNDARPLERFLQWVHADEWRAAHTYLYAELERVWREWPQAFPALLGETEESKGSFYG